MRARKLAPGEVSVLAETRCLSAEALARIQFPDAKPALPALLQALRKDPEVKVRQRAIWAFLNADVESLPGAKEALLDCLKDSRPVIRYDAARSLAQALRQRAPKAVLDTLEEMLNDTKLKIYCKTKVNVTSVGGENAAPGKQGKVQEDISGDGRYMAAQALAYIGPAAKRPGILRALNELKISRDERLREESRKALVAIDK